MRSEHYIFAGHNGHKLHGRLELPDDKPRAYALFAHCFTCGKDFVASRTIAQALAKQSIATLRFDFTGLGNSEGDFGNTHFTSNVADLIEAAKALEKTHEAPKLLLGHSLGGAAILAAAPFIESATSVATLAAPFDPSHVLHLFKDDIDTINKAGKANVDLSGRQFTISKQFIQDASQQNQRQNIARMGKALLVMHAPTDQTVGVENAKMIFDSALHPKSFISLDGMDHLLTKQSDVRYAASLLASWAERYLFQPPKTVPANKAHRESDGKVSVYSTGNGPFSMMVQAGTHTVLADEPMSVGGKDTGATPYDFLLAAIGTCTAMTLRMYANRKKLPLEDVRVNLSQQRIHADDCSDCETTSGTIHEITKEIVLKGDLTDAQQQKLLEIADKCPVHKTLEGEIAMRAHLEPLRTKGL